MYPLLLLATLSGCRPDDPKSVLESGRVDVPVTAPRNVLMLSLDTFRRTAMGRYGGGADTPFLDGLAEEGIALDQHQTCSAWTYPGFTCALTGQMPYHFGIMPIIGRPLEEMPPLPEGTETLATRLAASGYQTSLINTNDHLGPYHGLDAGYGWYEILPDGDPATRVPADADAVVDHALARLRGGGVDPARPWMMHLHFIDPHAPHAPPEAYRGMLEGRPALPWDLTTVDGQVVYMRERDSLDEATRAEADLQIRLLYEAEIRFLDDQIGRLLAEMDAEGWLEETTVVVFNDHGEQFWERGLLGHGKFLYAEENDGVLLFWWKGVAPMAWSGGTSSLDLLPTLLSFLGLPVPEELPGHVAGHAPELRPRLGVVWDGGEAPAQTVTVGEQKLMYGWDGAIGLYARDTDPLELSNRYVPGDPSLEPMWRIMRSEVGKLRPAVQGYTPQGLP